MELWDIQALYVNFRSMLKQYHFAVPIMIPHAIRPNLKNQEDS